LVAGSITFGQSLMYDANNSGVMTELIQNVLSRMNRRTFSDFTAGDPNFPSSAGKPDLLVRRPGEDSLRIYRGLANETLVPGGQILAQSGWGSFDLVLPVGVLIPTATRMCWPATAPSVCTSSRAMARGV
jgi:hypothetical protein